MSLDDMMRPKVVNTYEIDAFVSKAVSIETMLNNSIIITDRSFEEASEIRKQFDPDLHIYFAPYTVADKTDEKAANHKLNIIQFLKNIGYEHGYHFEVSDIQTALMKKNMTTLRMVCISD
ncbi:MAG TPA: hypothetical protein VFM18_09965 [Methanosarcina sp.]|nr:hypothetical protein [Methanosarcina sp.]